MAKIATIVVAFRNGTIICDPAVTVYKNDWVQWIADPDDPELRFKLEFVSPSGAWPFLQPPRPPGNATDWVDRFLAKVGANADEQFKYNVVVGKDRYDPIIIVGRV